MNNPHRSFPVGTADKISEWSETNRGHALPQWQIDLLRQMEIQPMTNPDIQQSKEWAESRANGNYALSEETRAVVKVIQSLPDQWIDADRVREVLDMWAGNPSPTSDEVAVLNDFEALLTPSLPTLADMTPEEREACQWMQADFQGSNGELRVVITKSHGATVDILLPSGAVSCVYADTLTPLPGEPKMKWPGSHADTITAESVEDVQAGRVADFDPALPCPEDVPAGEAWIVQHEGVEGVGCRNEPESTLPWLVILRDEHQFDYCYDTEITLVSRLVPEVKP